MLLGSFAKRRSWLLSFRRQWERRGKNTTPADRLSTIRQSANRPINYSITRLPDYPIGLPSADAPLVLLLEDVGGVEIECGGGSRVRAAELRVAAVTDGD